ncbi:hypothetical protein AURDEDRAFT_129086 [Auricularia subglabra TFB-10046 SS5]|nr:hypothetical protein AURDEDRAFT_129086 [Auricularia subglabra TFB-10046 SS5]
MPERRPSSVARSRGSHLNHRAGSIVERGGRAATSKHNGGVFVTPPDLARGSGSKFQSPGRTTLRGGGPHGRGGGHSDGIHASFSFQLWPTLSFPGARGASPQPSAVHSLRTSSSAAPTSGASGPAPPRTTVPINVSPQPTDVTTSSAGPITTVTPRDGTTVPTTHPRPGSPSGNKPSGHGRAFPVAAAAAIGAVLGLSVILAVWLWLRKRRRALARAYPDSGAVSRSVASTHSTSTVPLFATASDFGVAELRADMPISHPREADAYGPSDFASLWSASGKVSASTVSV